MKRKLLTSLLLALGFLFGSMSYVNAQCTISGLNANYCTTSGPSTLSAGTPSGTFSGAGMTGSVFSPSLAGPGTFTINYNVCSSSYSITTGTYSPLPVATATAGTSETLGDDQLSSSIAIGFSFKFFCNTYTNYYISSNGFITFNASAGNGCCSGGSMPTSSTPDNLIAYAWTDLYPPAGGSITHTLIGTAPNRIQVICFNGVNHYNSATYCCPITSQIWLYETTNVIEIHTTTKPLPTNTYSTTMGIQNSGGTVAYPVTGRNASSTWTATNECYRWTPGASCNVNQVTTVSPSTISVIGTNSICNGSTATLTASGNSTYTWSTGSNGTSINPTPTSNQSYSVSGTNSFGCVANSVITVTVDNTPTVTATSSNGSGVCPGKTVTVNGAGATSYTWTGASPTITNGVAFAPPTSGVYTVTGGNACGTATAAISVSIYPLPSFTPVASSASICSGASLTLTAVGNATAYTWSSGIANGAGFNPALTATYTVIGTSALSCTASATIPVTVVTTPSVASVVSPSLICIGNSSTLTASGASSYTWTGGSQTVTTNSLVATPATSGISTYTIMRANSTCTTSQVVTLVTNGLPFVFAIVSPTLVCAGQPASLTVAGGQTYTWTSPGAPPTTPSFSFTGASPLAFPPVTTIYTVAANDGTCVNTTTVQLNVNPVPVILTTASPATLCSGSSVSITASGGTNYTIVPSGASMQTSYSLPVVQTLTTSTSFQVTGDNSFGCTSTANQVVVVYGNPTLTTVPNKTIVCSGGTVSINATGANTYLWNTGATTQSTIVNPVNTISGPVVFTVTGTFTNTLCHTDKTVSVNVFIPTITVSGNTSTCIGGMINLNASGATGNNYQWTTTAGGNPTPGNSINTTITSPAVYTISILTTSGTAVLCPATKTIDVNVFFNPTITAVAQRTPICTKESVVLTASGGATYLWNTGPNTQTISVSPSNTTNYTVTGTDVNGCVSTGTVQVKVSGCAGIVPNTANLGLSIYPNPSNGEFMIQSSVDLKLTLVNDLGQLIRVIELSGANSYKVSVNDLAKGIYFLTGQKDNVQVNQKVIVTK